MILLMSAIINTGYQEFYNVNKYSNGGCATSFDYLHIYLHFDECNAMVAVFKNCRKN